jgi:hypothetical protein
VDVALKEPSAAWFGPWSGLAAEELKSAKVLGWDEESWNYGVPLPASSSKTWDQLTDDEGYAAARFYLKGIGTKGVSKKKEISKAWFSTWTNLTANETANLVILGFDQEMFDAGVMPITYAKPWSELSPSQQDALSSFNWTTVSWNTKKPSTSCKAESRGTGKEVCEGHGYVHPWTCEQQGCCTFSMAFKECRSKVGAEQCPPVKARSEEWVARWSNLTRTQATAATILGWEKESWNSWTASEEKLPPSNSKSWAELFPKEQAAAAVFCWEQLTWDEAAPPKGKGPEPLPLCNWTADVEGVARPANCMTVATGEVTCERGNQTFDETVCTPPAVKRCSNPIHDGRMDHTLFVLSNVPEGDFQHGADLEITCTENATAVDYRYPLEAWGQDWYPGTRRTRHACSNGTILHMQATKAEYFPGHPLFKPSGIRPTDLKCVHKEQVKLTQDMVQYLRWTEPRMAEAEAKGYKWIDMDALMHKKLLREAMNKSAKWEKEARGLGQVGTTLSAPIMAGATTIEVADQTSFSIGDVIQIGTETNEVKGISSIILNHPVIGDHPAGEPINLLPAGEPQFASIEDLKSVIKALIDHRMVPRGEPMTQETCKDLEKHWLYQLENSDPFKAAGNIGYANYVPPVDEEKGFPTIEDVPMKRPIKFTCSYTLQKSAAGIDPYTRVMNYHYRDGCYCESRWSGGCPFRAELHPSFKVFGFDTVEIKTVSTKPGAATNALCWYMTKAANPEWGYLRSNLGYTFQAPLKNVTELKSEWLKMKELAMSARFEDGLTGR